MRATTVNEATVRASAAHAGLPLSEERVAAVTALLRAWLPPANALSARMQVAELAELMPAVIFSNPNTDAQEDRG